MRRSRVSALWLSVVLPVLACSANDGRLDLSGSGGSTSTGGDSGIAAGGGATGSTGGAGVGGQGGSGPGALGGAGGAGSGGTTAAGGATGARDGGAPGGGADTHPAGTGGASGGTGGVTGSAGAGGTIARSLASIVDERPIGGASLQSGTTGGGTYAAAMAAGTLVNVTSVSQFLSAVSGTTPRIILIAAGTYDFTTTATTVQVCHVACNPATPVAFEATGSFFCPAGAALLNASLTSTKVTIGSNKTIIGLAAGATLKNLEINLSNSSNIILRNLTLSDINPGILDQGDALLMWPSDHVWVDHCSFVNASHSFLNIASGWDAAGNLTTLTGYMTFSWNRFYGVTTNSCGGKTHFAIGTNRNPGLTFHHNWIDNSNGRNPSLFGPYTWVHMFNNYTSTITYYGVAALCGASTLLEGNAFSKVVWAIYNNDGGAPTYSYCHAGYFGNVYAPLNDATFGARNNLLDAASTTNLGGQTTFSSAVAVPTLVSGLTYRVTVPAAPGFAATSYAYTLDASPSTVATTVPAGAGVGHLF